LLRASAEQKYSGEEAEEGNPSIQIRIFQIEQEQAFAL
jgi:hypothetical protein